MSEDIPDRSQGYTIHSLAREIDRLNRDVSRRVAKDVFDMAQGSNRVDIGRLDHQLALLDNAMDTLKATAKMDTEHAIAKAESQLKEMRLALDAAAKETDRRFRAIVVGVLVVFVAPLTVGLILVAVNLLGRK